MKKTRVINLIAGPGTGKSTLAALVFVHMKIAGADIEYVPEYAKQLVWKKEYDILNNQYYVSKQQYELFKAIDGVVDYIVTDGSLIHGLHYNKFNPDNTSDIQKTEKKILECYNEFENINIFLERNSDIAYEEAGRIQNLEEAKTSDFELLQILQSNNIIYKKILSDVKSINEIIEYINFKKE